MKKAVVTTLILLFLFATNNYLAAETEIQPQLDLNGKEAIFGFYPKFQMVMPDIVHKTGAINLYVGGKWQKGQHYFRTETCEILTGGKCDRSGICTALISLRAEMTFPELFNLSEGDPGKSYHVFAMDFEYYFREQGIYTWWAIERCLVPIDTLGNGIFIGLENEFYRDRNGAPDPYDFGLRINVPVYMFKIKPVWYFRRELLRIYISLDMTTKR